MHSRQQHLSLQTFSDACATPPSGVSDTSQDTKLFGGIEQDTHERGFRHLDLRGQPQARQASSRKPGFEVRGHPKFKAYLDELEGSTRKEGIELLKRMLGPRTTMVMS